MAQSKTKSKQSESGEEGDEPKRKSAPGVRHRRDNGPAELAVDPVPPPKPQDLGTLTRWSEEILSGGPRALIAAEHQAAKLAERFGVEIEAHWCLKTPYITELEGKGQHDAARWALAWRPRFLAVLSLSASELFASRAAKISMMTPRRHRAHDPEFTRQCEEAHQNAIMLLHDVTMKSAIEGECEPVFWQGIPIGHIRKVDNRLRIEMLRAHMPKTFKTPGAKVAISTGNTQNNLFILDSEGQDELINLRRQALDRMAQQRGLTIPADVVSVEG